MTTIKNTTKKAQGLIWSYDHGKACTSIFDAYGKPSRAKEIAFRTCEALRDQFNGYGARITGSSSHFFSYAFKYLDSENAEHLVYITHANDYDVKLA